jgi:hypothetical protein
MELNSFPCESLQQTLTKDTDLLEWPISIMAQDDQQPKKKSREKGMTNRRNSYILT